VENEMDIDERANPQIDVECLVGELEDGGSGTEMTAANREDENQLTLKK
jgi:hypothetical protein